ncbi:hypothetical protein U9M48_038174 [Paspalum notatum var. saurae]|uniref:Uncharacterized protein n=1 Tax=Paspalum notatum var. saurae TaxID=547442 RepID=A0AAQ3XBU5_PASNO
MATTEVLRAHNILLLPAASQRQTRTVSAAAHRSRRPAAGSNSAVFATARRSSPPAGTSAPAGRSRRHHGRKTGPAAEVYAGPAFSTSPEPSSLPLPHFPAKKQAALVDDVATRGLRRILRLDS